VRGRVVAVGLTALLAVGTTACGSGTEEASGGESGAETRYAAAVDRFCREVSSAVTRVQEDLAGVQQREGTGVDAASAAVGGALTGFAQDVDTSLGRLRRAEVPPEYRSFHDGATSGLGRVVTALRDAGTRAQDGDVRAIAQLGTTLEDVRVPDPPPALRERAPSCRALQRPSSG
jgi:hypothetical protein